MGTVLAFFTSKDVVHLWSILALLLGMSYWVWVFLGGKMGLNHRTRVLMVSVSLTASIWLWKIAYIIFSDQFAWSLIFDKLVESVRMFSLEQKYSEFVPELSRMLTTIWPVMANKFIAFAVKVGFSLLYFSAPATGAFVILNVILRFFSKLALWQKAVFSKKEIFYFSKLNES